MKKEKYSVYSIVSLILGLFGVIPLVCLTFFPSVLALIFGIVGLKEVKAKKLEGKPFAIAGIVLGSIMIVANLIFWITMIVILIQK